MLRKMAWVESAKNLVFKESEIPDLKENEILLKTQYSAVCGSDLHLYKDVHPFVKAPSTIGHELSGVVVAMGSNVTGFKEGDLVAPEPILVCGKCEYCLRGNYHMCNSVSYQYRKGQAGFADYFLVDARFAHKVPENVSPKAAALIEPFSVAIHGVEKAGEMLGKTVAVIGSGAIGTLAAALCREKGSAKVWIIDLNDYRLEKAKELTGATGLNSKTTNVVEIIREETRDIGCDIVIECTGVEACAISALEMVRKLGIIVQMGISSKPFNNYPYAKILSKEITIKGSQGYCFDFEKAIALMAAGKIDLEKYVTDIFPYDRINEAFETVMAPDTKCMKAIISY
jgi:L-iditol 2-dehydrogenase